MFDSKDFCSATLRCLGIVEILRNIVRYTAAGGSVCTAATLSYTSRIFHDLAQEVVWEELDTLGDLFACFPEEVWDAERDPPRSFNRPPTPADWKRVLANAAHVKTLTLNSSNCGVMAGDWAMIAIHCPEKVIFPNLKDLDWEDDDDKKALSYAHLLLGPKLWRLTLRIGEDAHVNAAVERATSLLNTVAYQRPPLCSLNVFISGAKTMIREALINVVQSTELECFQSTLLLTKKEVLALAKSKTLDNADFCCYPSLVHIGDDVFAEGIFPEVTSMRMSVDNLDERSVRRLITDARSPYLEEICLKSATDPRQSTLLEFLQELARRPSVNAIRTLQLGFAEDKYRHVPPPTEEPECTLGPKVLQNIFAFRCLIHLRIRSRYLDINPEIFGQICTHLPQLHTLLLLPTYHSGRPSKLTMYAVSMAAFNLPCLRELGVPLHTTDMRFTAPLGGQAFNQSCTKLHVADSPLDAADVENVALFLSSWLWNPALEIVACDPTVPAADALAEFHAQWRGAWADCQKLLRPLARARQQERFRGGYRDAGVATEWTVPEKWLPADEPPYHLPLIPIYSRVPLA
ncbi:hypothetical protein PsYK624_144650 [Phanerochaete sordida]|uniref:Uncharacterized protein n=1 Tax=Phanerochaete sordida TaxID=48140 RepID=A0A9P3GRU2_9APHY|nr:hypothetical protein PsYK624_144650 [Phanerochaete sordida]